VRLLTLGVFTCSVVVSVAGQCPIQPREAFLDSTGKNLSIRYYNSGTQVVRAVQFTLTKTEGGKQDRSVIATYGAGGTLRAKNEKTVVFKGRVDESSLIYTAPTGSVEVLVVRVAFADLSAWNPLRDNPCRVSLTQWQSAK
jgi:hypothetical protein